MVDNLNKWFTFQTLLQCSKFTDFLQGFVEGAKWKDGPHWETEYMVMSLRGPNWHERKFSWLFKGAKLKRKYIFKRSGMCTEWEPPSVSAEIFSYIFKYTFYSMYIKCTWDISGGICVAWPILWNPSLILVFLNRGKVRSYMFDDNQENNISSTATVEVQST